MQKVGVSKKMRFRVVGKNAASSGFRVSVDVLKLYNTGRRFEVETSNPTVSAGDSRAAVVDTAASGGKVDVSQFNTAGDFVKVTIPVSLAGEYRLAVRYRTGTDRGQFQVKLDGTTNVGAVVDGYATTTGYIATELGPVTITSPGNHEVRFTVSGKNASASSFGVSADYVELRHGPVQQLTGYVPASKATRPLIGPLPAATALNLSLSLPVRDRAGLDTLVRQISDPASASFGQSLTPSQLTDTYGPTAVDYQAVIDWANANGLDVVQTYPNRTLIDVRTTAGAVNSALFGTLVQRQRVDGTTFFMFDREPSISTSTPVLWIGGLDNFVLPQVHGGSGANSNAGGAYLGLDFTRAYSSCAFHLTGAGQRVGILALGGINVADVTAYQTAANRVTRVPVTVASQGPAQASDGGEFAFEVTMDAEMAIAMAPGLAELVIFQGGSPASLLASMATRQPLCNQLSSSFEYGSDSGTQQQLATIAAQGQSYFAASGDNGAYGSSPDNSLAGGPQTMVGGTTLTMNGLGLSWASETTWNEGSGKISGGGIVSLAPGGIPDYQQGISMATNGGSTTSRNAPDVAVVATNIEVIANFSLNGAPANQGPWISGGTSAASPLWAGFMALANEQRQAAGRKPLGFANPSLYGILKAPSIYGITFNDVQDNSNNGTFHAVAGYDLTTGIGTPKCNLLYQLSAASVATAVPTTTITLTGNVTLDLTLRDGTTSSTNTPVNQHVHLGVANPTADYTIIADSNVPAVVTGALRLAPNPVDTLVVLQGFELGPASNNSIPGTTIPAGGSRPLTTGVTTSFPPTSPFASAHMAWSLTAQSSTP